jgi:hypothetical protein
MENAIIDLIKRTLLEKMEQYAISSPTNNKQDFQVKIARVDAFHLDEGQEK